MKRFPFATDSPAFALSKMPSEIETMNLGADHIDVGRGNADIVMTATTLAAGG